MGHRLFKVDQYVVTSDGLTGYIFEDRGGCTDIADIARYNIAICEHDEERLVSASRLTPWVSKAGDGNLEPVWSAR